MAEKNWTEPNRSPYEGEQTPLLVDAQGIPVNVILTKADRHDVTRLLPRIDGVPPIRGKRGWPLKKPKCLQADRAYDSRAHCRAGELMGVEALVRWQHPVHGIVSPLTFIPLAEESGLIVAVGEWVLKTACEQAVAWQEQCMPPLHVAVNLSAGQFHRNDFLTTLKTVLRDTGMAATSLELEITESMLMDDPDAAAAILQEIHATGVQIAIDDFGTVPVVPEAFPDSLPENRSGLHPGSAG